MELLLTAWHAASVDFKATGQMVKESSIISEDNASKTVSIGIAGAEVVMAKNHGNSKVTLSGGSGR